LVREHTKVDWEKITASERVRRLIYRREALVADRTPGPHPHGDLKVSIELSRAKSLSAPLANSHPEKPEKKKKSRIF
jgi:hypothetical protein